MCWIVMLINLLMLTHFTTSSSSEASFTDVFIGSRQHIRHVCRHVGRQYLQVDNSHPVNGRSNSEIERNIENNAIDKVSFTIIQ